MATPPSSAPPPAGARDSGGRHDAGRAPRGGSPVARFLQRATSAAALVPMVLLSAAAADTLHPPAAVGAVGRLDGVRDARAASLFVTMREETRAACGSRRTTSGFSQCARSSSTLSVPR
eukprot:1021015-Prymnesium_polylepis.1